MNEDMENMDNYLMNGKNYVKAMKEKLKDLKSDDS